MATISLEEFSNEQAHLAWMDIEEVFKKLKCTKEGLTTEQGERRRHIFGPNKPDEMKYTKFLAIMWDPLSWFMGTAAAMAFVISNRDGKPPDWPYFLGFVILFTGIIFNLVEKKNAGNAAAALMGGLAQKTKVLRDGKWSEIEAETLVPGDIITVKAGDIVPADARLLQGDPIKIDRSSLPRIPGDAIFSGWTCEQGEIEAVVIATGVHADYEQSADSDESANEIGRFQKVLSAVRRFCVRSVALGILVEIIVMYAVRHRNGREGIDNLLVLLVGGIPMAMPTVVLVTMAFGFRRLCKRGAIAKRMTAIEELAGMDILCCDKTGTLTLNKPSVDKNLVEVFAPGLDRDSAVLLAARASRIGSHDPIDSAIVGMLADPKEAREGIQEVHFLPFNQVEKRTAIMYVDLADGSWRRASKGAPEQIIELCKLTGDRKKKVRAMVTKFAERGLRTLAVAQQTIPHQAVRSAGSPWEFVALFPLFDPPRHDSAGAILRALTFGIDVKMITGDELAIAKETARRLGMGNNVYPSPGILENGLMEKADGFAGVLPLHKYHVVKKLQERKHVCGMTGDGVSDVPALKAADIGIAVAGAADAARNASDIVLTKPGLIVIVTAVLTSREILQRMKNYAVYAVSTTARTVLGFLLLALIWKFDFSPLMVLLIAVLNGGIMMAISEDAVKPSLLPYSLNLREILVNGFVLGTYLALTTVIFFWAANDTDFFTDVFCLEPMRGNHERLNAAVCLQVSIISQALIFVTRSRGWSFTERPGFFLAAAFVAVQTVATTMAAKIDMRFAKLESIGWRWAMTIWLYNILTYFPLDLLKFAVRNAIGEA